MEVLLITCSEAYEEIIRDIRMERDPAGISCACKDGLVLSMHDLHAAKATTRDSTIVLPKKIRLDC